MSATVRLSDKSALVFEPITPTPSNPVKRILMTIEGRMPGDALNVALIPVSCIPAIIASLELAASQSRP